MIQQWMTVMAMRSTAEPMHIALAILKMDRTIQRMQLTENVQFFKTDYLE